MVSAFVAGSVVLALATLFLLAKTPSHRPQTLWPGSKGRLRRMLRVAVRRAARRHEHWLSPVEWNAGSSPFRTPHAPPGTARRR
jgi:hypothetical protein